MSYDNHIVDFFPTTQAAFVYCESKLIRIYFFDSFQQRQPPIIAKWSSTSTLHRTGAKTANGISRPLPTSVGSWCQHLCPRNCDRSTMCAVCQSARMMKFKWVSKLWRWKRRKKKYEHRAVGVNCAKRGCVANYLLSFYQDSRVSSLNCQFKCVN